MDLRVIARIRTDFPEKFGIPRQSGLLETTGQIVFEPEFRRSEAVRGLEGFDYLWLLWQFEDISQEKWTPLVRPPRLGGKETMGVFATRSPYRPNPIGLSSVKLLGIKEADEGPILLVSGVDLRDNTPIFDIKPYLEYADSHPNARSGFADTVTEEPLSVVFPEELLRELPEEKREAAVKLLSLDPRPRYGDRDGSRYGVAFAGKDLRFFVENGVLTVVDVVDYGKSNVK